MDSMVPTPRRRTVRRTRFGLHNFPLRFMFCGSAGLTRSEVQRYRCMWCAKWEYFLWPWDPSHFINSFTIFSNRTHWLFLSTCDPWMHTCGEQISNPNERSMSIWLCEKCFHRFSLMTSPTYSTFVEFLSCTHLWKCEKNCFVLSVWILCWIFRSNATH